MREVICYTKSEKLGILRKVLKFGNFGQIFFEFRIQKGHFLFVPRCYYQDFSDLLNEFLYFESSVIRCCLLEFFKIEILNTKMYTLTYQMVCQECTHFPLPGYHTLIAPLPQLWKSIVWLHKPTFLKAENCCSAEEVFSSSEYKCVHSLGKHINMREVPCYTPIWGCCEGVEIWQFRANFFWISHFKRTPEDNILWWLHSLA